MTNRRYLPETFDPIVLDLHCQWQLTPFDIAQRLGFSIDTVKTQMRRLGLTPHRRVTQPGKPMKDPLPPKGKPNPLAIARLWLGTRLVEKPSGYWLDSVPVGLTGIMQATNRLMKKEGAEQIAYSADWLV